MWHDENNEIMKLYKILEEHDSYCPLPAVCPVCGSKSGHLYMQRYDGDHRGGSWVWCSNCHSYSHASCKVPEWWRNLSTISILKLEHSPDYLEAQTEQIDSFVNKLLAIHDDRLLKQKPCDWVCEKCGTLMIKKLPEDRAGTYSITCPNCGWGAVTTYTDPICMDKTRYSIILLEGNETSVEVVRAVNQVSHQNLVKTKELIVKAPQVIFEGNALETYGMKEILDAGFVDYRIEPDFPYV
ncbi:hypothetical protein [Butyrivibrio sp. AE2032]|uniref:hypothetical protein n=1 Tax=Butyrivibrio sp. AE2032 TaxID=1458463 RepID=UPI000551DBBF|nr:hypothetical protein [Butyrivibrio sp. AE2032]